MAYSQALWLLLSFAVKRIKGEENVFPWLKFCSLIREKVQNDILSLLTEHCSSTVTDLCQMLFLLHGFMNGRSQADIGHLKDNSWWQIWIASVTKLEKFGRKLVARLVLSELHSGGQKQKVESAGLGK